LGSRPSLILFVYPEFDFLRHIHYGGIYESKETDGQSVTAIGIFIWGGYIAQRVPQWGPGTKPQYGV